MISHLHSRPSEYFRALVEFERDSLPATDPCEVHGAVSADLRCASLPERAAGSAQSPKIQDPPSGGDCAEEFLLSQLAPLERV